MSGTIRSYTPEDRAAIVTMLAGSEPWKKLGYTDADWKKLFDPFPSGREGFVIEAGGAAAGFALLRPKFLLGDYLELLVVAPSARHNGLGSALLKHIEGVVFERVKNLFACVSDFNAEARKFYQKNGYQEIGPMPNFLIPGSAEILLRKTTGPTRSNG
jgi:ribosomal protein S18 acetylase RimI-like enzyme